MDFVGFENRVGLFVQFAGILASDEARQDSSKSHKLSFVNKTKAPRRRSAPRAKLTPAGGRLQDRVFLMEGFQPENQSSPLAYILIQNIINYHDSDPVTEH
jgi:hypothetical protein